MSLWERDPMTYRKRYYEGEPYFSTPYTEFGNKVGEALETGKLFDPILENIPRYSEMEYEILVEIGGAPILMYLDSFDPETKKILEYKTGILGPGGRKPWDRLKVRKHSQLTIYTLGVKKKHGEWNPDVQLIWIETEWSTRVHEVEFGGELFQSQDTELQLTGNIEIFDRTIAEWELDRMEKKIINVAKEISQDFKAWKKYGTLK